MESGWGEMTPVLQLPCCPSRARGTLRNVFTKPFTQPAAPRCNYLSCCRYYQCVDPEGDQLFSVEEHDCGDWMFDPNLNTCVDPDRPGNEGLCPEEEAL